jgi:selenide,water dikinase
LLIGPEKFSDAGVFRVRPDLALVTTVDFFPPVVDDPFLYGAIAAANALSDCYAMGGKPLVALCVAGFPNELPKEWIQKIFEGGFGKIAEAGAVIAGGHTVRHSEPMFGFSVTGEVDPARMLTNERARPGDLLYLTKPLGCGPVTTGVKRGKTLPEWAEAAMRSMATLNRAASEAAVEAGATACTDITGFGLLGHAANVARASEVTLAFESSRLPFLPGALSLAAAGVMSGAAGRNRVSLEGDCEYGAGVSSELVSAVLDSETSGGLLISIPPGRSGDLEDRLRRRHVMVCRVGAVESRGAVSIRILR